MGGQRREATAALLRAEDDLAAAVPGDEDPHRVWFFQRASLAHETARTLWALGDLEGTLREFRNSVLTRKAETFSRTHAVTLGYMGTVQARQGDVEAASTVSKNSRGYDAGKKINGRKRHITVDTLGLPVMITVTPANLQDRDAARDVFWRLRLTQPQITQVWADRGYAGDLVDWARERLWITLRIVSRPKGTKCFVVLPRRWKVERTIGWCMNARRNARDHERLPQHSEAHLNWALITVMTKRLTRKGSRTSRWTKKPSPTC